MAQMEYLVTQAYPVSMEQMAPQVLVAIQDNQVSMAQMEYLVTQVYQVSMAQMEHLVIQA